MKDNFDIETNEEVKKIWKENEEIADELADCYYDSILDEYNKYIEKDTKENFGYNAFSDGIRVGLDIILPLLSDFDRIKIKEKINSMVEKRRKIEGQKMLKVNCSFCGKEIECPEDMSKTSEKHLCYECFKRKAKGLDFSELSEGKIHIDIPLEKELELRKEAEEYSKEMLFSTFKKEIFEKEWHENKQKYKELSKEELALEMYELGLDSFFEFAKEGGDQREY